MSNPESHLHEALSDDALARIGHAEELLRQKGFENAHFIIWPSNNLRLEEMVNAVAALIETALGEGRSN